MAFMDMAGKFFTAGANPIGTIEELYLWKVRPDVR
jgi:hypothetical protein